jgi:Pregnancy-associated plasma protein-A
MKKILFSAFALAAIYSCQKDDLVTSETAPEVAITSSARRICKSQEMHELQLRQNPDLYAKMLEIENFTDNFALTYNPVLNNSSRLLANGKIEIPVIFNVLYRTASENISLAQLQSQIDVLNKDFNALNTDFNNPTPYASIKANVGITFVLDQVIRKATTKVSWSETDVNNNTMKKLASGGIAATTPTTKLNIWIVSSMPSSQGETLGYAQFPGGASSTDGLVFAGKFTGTTGTAQAPFNLGRTATHEVGHWMNLRHIWGDANCGSDLVADTPAMDSPNAGVPAAGLRSTCSGTPLEMFMNYMDYTDDRAMFMFSNGQKTRMNAVFAVGGSRASFRNL